MSDLDRQGDLETRIVDATTQVSSNVVTNFGVNRLAVRNLDAIAGLTDESKMYSYGRIGLNLVTKLVPNPMVRITNPLGSGKTLILRSVRATTVEGGNGTTFTVYANPTLTTTGTIDNPVNRKTLASPGSSVAVIAYNGATTLTASSNGTLMTVLGLSTGTSGGAERDFQFDLQIPANNTLIVCGSATANNSLCNVSICWAEV